jgi:hypothetical protein
MSTSASKRLVRFFLLGAVSALALFAARNAPAEAPGPGAAPVPTGPVNPGALSLAPKPIGIAKVTSQGPHIAYTLRNNTNADATVGFSRNDSNLIGAPTQVTIKARGELVDNYDADLGPLCVRPSFRWVQLTGAPNVDDRVHKATRLAQTFKTDIYLGGVGVPPPQSEIDKELRIVSVVLEQQYSCGHKLTAKVHLKNGTTVSPQHLTLQIRAMPNAGAGVGPVIGSTPIHLAPGAQGDFEVTTTDNVTGQAGWLTLYLEDTTTELGSHLGFYKIGRIDITDISSADWKLE